MTSPASDRYARQFLAGWRTMDFNGHLANTAYLDLAADVRVAFFAEHGFPPTEFRRLAIGPVVRKDEVEYFREVNLHETVTVTYAALAMSPDAARFTLENEIFNAAGERAAVVPLDRWLARPWRAKARRPAAGAHPGDAPGPACARVRRAAADVTNATAQSLHQWRPSVRRAGAATRIAHGLCYDRHGDIVE